MTHATASTLPTPARPLLHALARNWWLLALRGACAILFGILTFIWPAISLLTLVLFYGAFMLADGILAVAAAIKGDKAAPRGWLIVLGILSIIAGVLTFVWPGITALVLLFMIAAWSIAIGVMQIVGAIKLRKEIDNEWLLIAGGVLSVIFGVILLIAPGAGALALIVVIGAYAIIYGAIMIAFAWRLKNHSHATA